MLPSLAEVSGGGHGDGRAIWTRAVWTRAVWVWAVWTRNVWVWFWAVWTRAVWTRAVDQGSLGIVFILFVSFSSINLSSCKCVCVESY